MWNYNPPVFSSLLFIAGFFSLGDFLFIDLQQCAKRTKKRAKEKNMKRMSMQHPQLVLEKKVVRRFNETNRTNTKTRKALFSIFQLLCCSNSETEYLKQSAKKAIEWFKKNINIQSKVLCDWFTHDSLFGKGADRVKRLKQCILYTLIHFPTLQNIFRDAFACPTQFVVWFTYVGQVHMHMIESTQNLTVQKDYDKVKMHFSNIYDSCIRMLADLIDNDSVFIWSSVQNKMITKRISDVDHTLAAFAMLELRRH